MYLKRIISKIIEKLSYKLKPGQVISLGFLFIILSGALLLMLPISTKARVVTPFIDTLFTATSAVCVTGLVTLCTANHWSLFGKAIILFLIQIGGLGFVSIVMSIMALIGKKITLKERIIIQESFNLNTISGMVSFIKKVVKTALIVEAVGAFILFIRFLFDYNFFEALINGIFHSVSAFCNAGFDILGENSLMDYSGDYIVMPIMMLLIIFGGIGFTVLFDIDDRMRDVFNRESSLKVSLKKLTLHSKLALIVSFIMIILGGILFFIIEYNNPLTLAPLRFDNKIIASFFQSVTLRTAGYFSIDQGGLRDASKFISVIFMAIGGSPGGTAGGIKTVSFSIILIAVVSVIKGNDSISAFKKSISLHTLQKVLAVTMMIVSIISISAILISLAEIKSDFAFIDILFETASAMGTTGLSTGITPYLCNFSKVILIFCMFTGRLGPITLVVALASKKGGNNLLHYPEEKIIVG